MDGLLMWMTVTPAWLAAGAYALGVGSAIIPWMNAELLLLSVLPLAQTPAAVAALVAAMTLGQMTGKCAVYGAARRAGSLGRSARIGVMTERWRLRVERRPMSAMALVFGSAVIGVPPFYLVSMAAGAAGMAMTRFVFMGTCGRLLHFSGVAWLPDLIRAAV